jgi:hypothetical protein
MADNRTIETRLDELEEENGKLIELIDDMLACYCPNSTTQCVEFYERFRSIIKDAPHD